MLKERAAELAGRRGRTESATIDDQLTEIADGIDPAELPALSDALEDPGDAAYSPEALERFALLAGELRMLRAYAGEPILDVVRRIVDTTGIDIELASAVSPAAAARRDNLDLFLKAVAEFQAIDGDVTLPALLAYLTAEDDQGNGLDVATPTEADSVKLLTVHRAKGLEWDSVFLVGVCETRFPSNRSRTLWTSSPSVLPAPLRGDAADQPQLAGWDKPALDAYRADTRAHDQARGAPARVRRVHPRRAPPVGLVLPLEPARDAVRPLGRTSGVLADLAAAGEVEVTWLDKPEKGAPNPYAGQDPSKPWPVARGSGARPRCGSRPQPWCAMPTRRLPTGASTSSRPPGWATGTPSSSGCWPRPAQTAPVSSTVPLPSSLSATARRPAARRPRTSSPASWPGRCLASRRRPPASAPGSTPGSRRGSGSRACSTPTTCPGRGDLGIDDEDDLRELIARFESGPFADRVPVAVEPPFALVLAGQVVRGRIDAVYEEPDGSYLVVDWKTNARQDADPLQLAIYRVAWADLAGVPLDRVRVAFHYVRSGETVAPDDLADRQALEQILG